MDAIDSVQIAFATSDDALFIHWYKTWTQKAKPSQSASAQIIKPSYEIVIYLLGIQSI